MIAPSSASAEIDLPSRNDPVVAAATAAIGGPVGEHARINRRFWTPLRVVMALAIVVLALHWLQKAPCNDGNWSDFRQYRQACYTDVYALYFSEQLSEGKIPYLEHAVEYPVLTGFMMGLVGLPVHAITDDAWFADLHEWLYDVGIADSPDPNPAGYFYLVTALLLFGFALVTVWAVYKLRERRRPWDAAMVALAPAILVTATINWDLLAVALSTVAILAWARRYVVLAGVLLGLAAAAKFYPALFLLPLLVLCIRASKLPEFFVTAGAAVTTWLAVNVPIYLLAPDAWSRFYAFSQERGVDWGTFWYIGANWPLTAGEHGFGFFRDIRNNIPALNDLALVLFAFCCFGVVVLGLMARQQPRLAALIFLVVATFLLTNKVWSQQFVLWLIPLAVLARPQWGAFLAWQACEVLYFLGFYQILLNADGGQSVVPPEVFTFAAAARWISLAVLCGFVVYDILHPETDPVRTAGADDPEGGVLTDRVISELART